jgi:hypothetical protein
VGRGRIVVLAFDLPRCVLLLRQGDRPALGGTAGDGCCQQHAQNSSQ